MWNFPVELKFATNRSKQRVEHKCKFMNGRCAITKISPFFWFDVVKFLSVHRCFLECVQIRTMVNRTRSCLISNKSLLFANRTACISDSFSVFPLSYQILKSPNDKKAVRAKKNRRFIFTLRFAKLRLRSRENRISFPSQFHFPIYTFFPVVCLVLRIKKRNTVNLKKISGADTNEKWLRNGYIFHVRFKRKYDECLSGCVLVTYLPLSVFVSVSILGCVHCTQ